MRFFDTNHRPEQPACLDLMENYASHSIFALSVSGCRPSRTSHLYLFEKQRSGVPCFPASSERIAGLINIYGVDWNMEALSRECGIPAKISALR